jgi:hypothetical protein
MALILLSIREYMAVIDFSSSTMACSYKKGIVGGKTVQWKLWFIIIYKHTETSLSFSLFPTISSA